MVSTRDGDDVTVSQGTQQLRIRLACIDAPEMEQNPWGRHSATRLKQLLPPRQLARKHGLDLSIRGWQYG